MEESPITKKSIMITLIISCMVLIYVIFSNLSDNHTRLVFCNVGQGDASYIRVKNKVDILIDAGPDKKVLNCLGKHMPFYDRTIELAILTHPQKDHHYGYNHLIKRYRINNFILPPVDNSSTVFHELTKELHRQKIKMYFPKTGDVLNVSGNKLTFLWPSSNYLKENVTFAKNTSNKEPMVLGTSTDDLNNFSLIFTYEEDEFRALFTGDSSSDILNDLSQKHMIKSSVIKIPHHGSKNGITKKFLQLADPKIAVISVGANNSYGHPSAEVIAMLQALRIKIRRTDKEGDIVFRIP
jgi:competence protein ComEC